ncbi:LysE family transporter [Nevskia sp.]|uniref:LysE family transporter n=1 Tax=Nevskia sp. TaxID=1929292 RepID=UPI0025D0F11E|nr:LysE family transporter [Nevskia sp.]
MTLDTWLGFFVAAWLICLSPGPGVLSCVTAGLQHGFRAALWNIVGLQAGATVTLIVVGVGLGAVLATSPLAFNAIKWFGAAYLVYLGVMQWRSAEAPIRAPEAAVPGLAAVNVPRALFLRGLIVNSTNPKGILFTASVLPQFIDPKAPQLIQFLIVWFTLLFTDVCCMSSYTALGVQALRWLQNPGIARLTNRVFGALFVLAGLGLAVFKHGA